MSAKTQQWKGRIKQAAGTLLHNQKLEDEGRTDRRTGEAKEQVAKAKNKAIDLIDKAARSIDNALDSPKQRRR